jgi:arylsulfatase A-like enzyme
VLVGQGSYYNPILITNGERVKHEGYTTDLITDRAFDWLDKREKDKPFFLMCQHKAPHGRWEPALRHLGIFDDVTIPEPSTLFDDYAGRGKAASMHKMGIADHMGDARLMFKYSSKFTPAQFKVFDGYFRPRNESFLAAKLKGKERTRWHYQRYIKNYLSCVKAVDENVGRLLNYLDKQGLAENTVVIYSSDQGFYLGEHGWFDKRWMFDESLRTPLIARWPGVTKPGTESADMVSNVDFAETFLEMAGASVPSDMQGRSLVPILRGATPENWRTSHYYHYYEAGGHGVPIHYGVTTKSHKLIRYPAPIDEWELYDLKKDPRELNNVFGKPEYARTTKRLNKELGRLRKELKVDEEK